MAGGEIGAISVFDMKVLYIFKLNRPVSGSHLLFKYL